METRAHHLTRTALILSAAGLTVAACGSGGSAGTSTGTGTTTSTAAIVSTASVGGADALVDADGRTLYDADVESADHILCVATCTRFWKPLRASAQQAREASTALGRGFTTVSRPDGGTQLAYQGHPLYTFTQEGAHEMTGNGFTDEFGGTRFQWSAATTGGSPTVPPSTGSGGTGGSGGGGGYGY
jgi:predicted lipoprotein with Yx(FWY)xxD motif